ncbi:unnamed protein product, partial [marine sediment metagenome]
CYGKYLVMRGKVALVFEGKTEYFSFEKAQGLLCVRKEMNRHSTIKKKGWELPEDSPYEFKDNGLIKRRDTKNSKKQTKFSGDTKGDQSPTEA